MPHTRVWMVLMALVLVVSSLSSAQTTAQTSQPRGQKIPPKQAQLPPPPVGPLSQIPMDQIPPAPPHVSYQHGFLTIVAQNSTLAAILVDVRKLTGASIDVPPNATERVVTRLGPGPVRDVLAGLLNGTRFNYVMIGSPKDPAALSALLLTAKPGDVGTTANTPVAMAEQPTPAFTPEPVPAPVVVQVGPAVPDAEAEADADAEDKDSENDNQDAQAAAEQVAADQAAGQQQETEEQRQQRFDKLKAPPNAPQPPIIPPPNAPPQ